MYTAEERETFFNWDDSTDECVCSTFDKRIIKTLDKLCIESKDITRETLDDGMMAYKFPKSWVKIRKPRQISEEQREKMRDRASVNFSK